MRITDETLLDRFRHPGRCEWCGRPCTRREPAHLHSRGAGRLDLSCNIAALCRYCHQRSHDGHEPTRIDLLAVVARREGIFQNQIEAVVKVARKLSRNPTAEEFDRVVKMFDLSAGELAYVRKCLA